VADLATCVHESKRRSASDGARETWLEKVVIRDGLKGDKALWTCCFIDAVAELGRQT
jgi:hypothetical protein